MRAFSGLAAVAAPLVLLAASTGPAAAADIETEPRSISVTRDIETEPRPAGPRPDRQRAAVRRGGVLQDSVRRLRDIETEPRRSARDIETEPRRSARDIETEPRRSARDIETEPRR